MNSNTQSLAKIHALGISIKRKQPKNFNSKISPYLQTVPWTMDEAAFKVHDIILETPCIFLITEFPMNMVRD